MVFHELYSQRPALTFLPRKLPDSTKNIWLKTEKPPGSGQSAGIKLLTLPTPPRTEDKFSKF